MIKNQEQDEKQYAHGFDSLPTMMTVAELANFAGMSRNGIAEHIRNGRLRAFNICPGGRPKFRVMRDDIIKWLTGCPVKPIRTQGGK
jgi:excisionase family DNA binding protein